MLSTSEGVAPHRMELWMHNDPTPSVPVDSIEQLKADMAADPAVRPVIDEQINDEAQRFLDLAKGYAWKWMKLEDPWEATRILGQAVLWLEAANKQLDKELINQMRRDERYKKGGVLL